MRVISQPSTTKQIKDATLGENNTVALCSALILTVQFAFLVLHLDEDYDAITEVWGNTHAGRGWGDVFEDVSIPLQVSLITIQCLALFHSLIVILAVGEMSGEAEIMRLLQLLGKSANGGFVGFLIALVGFAIYVIFWCLMHMKRTEAIISLFIPFALCIAMMIWGWPGTINVIKAMFVVKADIPRGVPGRRPVPIVLSRTQIQQKLEEFSSQLEDKRLVSPENFRSWIQEMCSLENTGGEIGLLDLSWMTTKALEEEVNRKYQEYYPGGMES
mmetsp:Transcript_21525/g.33680  ORF Transcript_21525/g.33680 Transcript_21525/m.33680 type:complete len:273 (+) Transcript_21525:205-1023(+)